MREIQSDAKSLVVDEARLGALSASLRLAAVAVLVATLAGCMGYVPGRQSYWDAKVKEMCEKDGGVTVFEQIVVTPTQAKDLPRIDGLYGVRPETLSKPDDPAYSRTRATKIHDGQPSVVREEQEIVRRSDQRVIARVVRYGRSGADLPLSASHPSSYSCPEYGSIYESIHGIYRVEEVKK